MVFSCKKAGDAPAPEIPPVVIGTTVTDKDTTIVTVGNIVIKHNQTSPCYPGNELFTFTVTAKNTPIGAEYNWYFGDGNIASGTTVQHAYNATSPYVLTLEIKSSEKKLLSTATFSVKAWGQQIRPVVSFSVKPDFQEDLNYITFNSTSSINKGATVNYLWNWGDGFSESSAVGLTRHQFPTSTTDKIYPVKLTITTDVGCKGDTTVNVAIPATYPITGNFNAVAFNACTNEYFLFAPAATNVPTGAVYYWNFSDGRGDTTAKYPIRYAYKYMNDYDVIMSIYLNGRLIYKTHKLVNAKGENPTPRSLFYETLARTDANTVTWSFNSQSTVAHGGIDGYYWDFGNGNTDSQFNRYVENTYTKNTVAATYQVRLITTGNGCADTAYKTVNVIAK